MWEWSTIDETAPGMSDTIDEAADSKGIENPGCWVGLIEWELSPSCGVGKWCNIADAALGTSDRSDVTRASKGMENVGCSVGLARWKFESPSCEVGE